MFKPLFDFSYQPQQPFVEIYLRKPNDVCKLMMQSAIDREDYIEAARWRDLIKNKDRHPTTGEILDYE